MEHRRFRLSNYLTFFIHRRRRNVMGYYESMVYMIMRIV